VDEIRLRLPGKARYLPVAHLVLGGLGSRLDLTVEGLEDLKLAIDSLVERTRQGDDVTIAVRLENGTLRTEVGPFDDEVLRAQLAEQAGVGLRRILDAVVDGVEVLSDDDSAWVTLSKTIGGKAR
jgi:hypothetical protein